MSNCASVEREAFKVCTVANNMRPIALFHSREVARSYVKRLRAAGLAGIKIKKVRGEEAIAKVIEDLTSQ